MALLCGALLVLGACSAGKGENAGGAQAQKHFAALPGASFHVEILSDLGKSTLAYQYDYAYNSKGNDTLTLTAPEALAGITATIAGEEAPALTLQYEGTALDAPGPSKAGLTPADVIPYLFAELRNGSPTEIWTERADGVTLDVLKYVREDDDGTITRQVWLNGGAPQRAECYWNDALVLTCTFDSWNDTTTSSE